MAEQTVLPGSAYLQLVGGVALVHPEEQVWEAMRRGFAIQQQSRYLAPVTVDQRDGQLRRFAAWTNEYPWKWRPQDVEEWTSAAASERHLARTTVMGVHLTLRLFMEYLLDARYGWAAECEKRFGTHPVQICHEWNTVRHVGDYEGRPTNRPLSRPELQTLFDAADDRAERIRRQGRKGWTAAFRDATILKVAYAWGLRRREVSRLELNDWGRNPRAPEFRDVGALQIRWAKAVPGGPPRRRTCSPSSTGPSTTWRSTSPTSARSMTSRGWPPCGRPSGAGRRPTQTSARCSPTSATRPACRASSAPTACATAT